MERIVEQNLLYDFYGELLTAHQKEIYGEHILNDMTATEIAAEFGITRQAVHDMIGDAIRSWQIMKQDFIW